MILPAALHQTDARTTFPCDSSIVSLCSSRQMWGFTGFYFISLSSLYRWYRTTNIWRHKLSLRKLIWGFQCFDILLKVLSINEQISWWWRWSLVATFLSKAECLSLAAVVSTVPDSCSHVAALPAGETLRQKPFRPFRGQRFDSLKRQSMWLLSESFPPCVTNEKQTSPDRLLRLIVIYMYQ